MFAKPSPFARPTDAREASRPTPLTGGLPPGATQRAAAATPPEATPVATPPAAPSPKLADETSASRLVVGPDVKLKGAEILDCDTLEVEGRVEATMDSRVIRIRERGAFAGKVGIDVAEVHGCFEGELTARQRLVIHATGRVSGTIRYGSILIEEGGQISGDVRALGATAAERPAPPQEERGASVTPLALGAGTA